LEDLLTRSMLLVQDFVTGDGQLEPTLHELVVTATESLGADMASLTVRDQFDRPCTVVATAELVAIIDEAQYESGRGPCLEAARTHRCFTVDETADDDRWPEFAAAALEHGVHSSLSLPVLVANAGRGALNVYSRRPAAYDEEKTALGALHAGQCAIVAQHWTASSQAKNLSTALSSRADIEQAKGIIMATTGCSADEAFGILREQSQRENRKLREVAVEIARRQRH
jgi:signal transduction protein with GAF and PtsI domain